MLLAPGRLVPCPQSAFGDFVSLNHVEALLGGTVILDFGALIVRCENMAGIIFPEQFNPGIVCGPDAVVNLSLWGIRPKIAGGPIIFYDKVEASLLRCSYFPATHIVRFRIAERATQSA
jgi:hypothetical protein